MIAKKALVLGVNGQDGSYLCDKLLSQGWEVVGVGKQGESKWVKPSAMYTYRSLDISDLDSFETLLNSMHIDSIFHFAAIHGSAGFQYEAHWKNIQNVNVASLHGALEYFRKNNPNGVLVYASSSKVFFGKDHAAVITEESPRYSSCIYSTSKNAATDLVKYYRDRHGIAASVVWLFNHESPRRAASYFVPQIVTSLRQSLSNSCHKKSLETLNFLCDWGDAEEYMDIVVRLSIQKPGIDYILASGNTWYAEDYISKLFSQFELDWRNHITTRLDGVGEIPAKWIVDNSKITNLIGNRPQRSIIDISLDMLDKMERVVES
jgi:GDPmannose 4,6-dehydratase